MACWLQAGDRGPGTVLLRFGLRMPEMPGLGPTVDRRSREQPLPRAPLTLPDACPQLGRGRRATVPETQRPRRRGFKGKPSCLSALGSASGGAQASALACLRCGRRERPGAAPSPWGWRGGRGRAGRGEMRKLQGLQASCVPWHRVADQDREPRSGDAGRSSKLLGPQRPPCPTPGSCPSGSCPYGRVTPAALGQAQGERDAARARLSLPGGSEAYRRLAGARGR